MALRSLEDCFHDQLRDAFSAEKQLVKALPKMVAAASSEELQAAFAAHLEETQQQVERLQEVFASLDMTARAKKCEAMEGLIEEAQSVLEEDADDAVRDALLIAAAQKVEHYEIATYGTLCTWAELLGFDVALELLKQNLGEEKAADEKLTEVAGTVNAEANAPVATDGTAPATR
jgi:ferritin-like metal-binding protein YciE